jgi:sulfur carrier protein ThiS
MKIVYRDKVWELPGNTTVRDAIKKIGLNPESVLAMRDGKLLTDDVLIRPEDIIKLIAVVSGG